MKKFFIYFFFLVFLGFFILPKTYAQNQQQAIESTPKYIPCGCPADLDAIYQQKGSGESCVSSYQEFETDPVKKHFWVKDEEVTAQGKANDRARQFIFWVMTHPSIDNHPVLIKIWASARNLSYFFVILTAALLGLGIIIGQKTSYETGIKIWPSIIKILTSILYIAFSATIVITIIQLSEIIMKFFIENLGGKDLFNIYFSGISQENNYVSFEGCRDLNLLSQEAAKTEMFLLKLTNISYYLMGGMMILRKIILWFLLFVSPFLAILFSFSFLKNVGWIWIGVFFQWVFYGPLMALFLGALATVWKGGIPYIFDFSRSNLASGYIYPTAINILYGGPAQKLAASNNGNYVDTFVEYIITLIMLWAVTIFPWWLLRTFRDYCCDGINAVKNILLSNFGPGKTPGSPAPSLTPTNLASHIATSLKIQKDVETTVKTRIETVEEIKKAKTEEIVKSLNLQASKLTDIANFETNKQSTQTINYLKNPTQAETITERQRFMNIRVELSNRARKSDPLASQIVSSVFAPPLEQIKTRNSIIETLPKMIPVTQVVSVKVKLPTQKVQQISSSFASQVSANQDFIIAISKKTGISPDKVQQVIEIFNQPIDDPPSVIIEKINKQTNLEKEKIKELIKEYLEIIKNETKVIEKVANEYNLKPQEVKQVVEAQTPILTEPEKNIEQTIMIPQTVSIDEYEQVKKMWMSQYEKGEIPKTENIKTRESWVENDIVFITNTLNKLLSDNQELKQEGLDEIGYILPIFMVNNLNGEQLITYLKAKLEAAKTVKALIDKEKEVTERLKAESEKVEVLRPKKKEEEKVMTMEEELKN